MSEHKFEAGQLVMVRSALGEEWKLRHFSHYDATCEKYGSQFQTIGGGGHLFCIPYNEGTKHLRGTSRGYSPPKPPHEYKWGDRVEVLVNGERKEGIVLMTMDGTDTTAVFVRGRLSANIYLDRNIRPLEPANEQ